MRYLLDAAAVDEVVHVTAAPGGAEHLVQPDAHRVLGAEQRHVAHAFDAAERIDDAGGHDVAQVDPAHAVGHEAEHHQEIPACFRRGVDIGHRLQVGADGVIVMLAADAFDGQQL